jgi:hypothetical protein
MLACRAVVTCSLSASLVPYPRRNASSAAIARGTFGWATIAGMDAHRRRVTAVAMDSRHIRASAPLDRPHNHALSLLVASRS